MMSSNAVAVYKTVSDPNASYESLKNTWSKCRVICSGERAVKDFDETIDVINYTNLLIPFSPSMSQKQYSFYLAEAELPGVTMQFAKMLVGGLLRKRPILTLPKEVPEKAKDWLINCFGPDDSTMSSFLFDAFWEEIQTSRAWIVVDHPVVKNEDLSKEEKDRIHPYPILWKAESIINWSVRTDSNGKRQLNKLMVKSLKEDYSKNEFHPDYYEEVRVHELDENGFYQIRVFRTPAPKAVVTVSSGSIVPDKNAVLKEELVETITDILINNERLTFIPAWPLNGSIEAIPPMLTAIVDKEVSLYNKVSRRNHLLYGAATYTPIIASDMSDDDFTEIVNAGLGSWLKLNQGDTASVLETPTVALQDMDRAIASAYEELAKLGVRMLANEDGQAQSGVALEIRNASQTSQLALLNTRASSTMKSIIACMINWHYGLNIEANLIEFSLSEDFDPVPIGADWLRLATEWYQQGLIPRNVWLILLKRNDMVPEDYDDEVAIGIINSDILIQPKGDPNYAATLTQ